MQNLLVSFSGGETSGYMAQRLKREYSDRYRLHFVFANTSKEHQKTLEFVDQCDREYDLGVVWVEAVVHLCTRRACTNKVVDFETAARDGEVFEEVIRKYGIPNKAYPHCNRELKLNPIHSWAREHLGTYVTAIGIREDERGRVAKNADSMFSEGIVYPLVDWFPTDKIDVHDFWDDQPFRLDIPTHHGNCTTCWKKSDRKLLTIMDEHPEWFDFFRRMEAEHGYSGHVTHGPGRVFFRGGRSVADLEKEHALGLYRKFEDNRHLDENDGCTEECTGF